MRLQNMVLYEDIRVCALRETYERRHGILESQLQFEWVPKKLCTRKQRWRQRIRWCAGILSFASFRMFFKNPQMYESLFLICNEIINLQIKIERIAIPNEVTDQSRKPALFNSWVPPTTWTKLLSSILPTGKPYDLTTMNIIQFGISEHSNNTDVGSMAKLLLLLRCAVIIMSPTFFYLWLPSLFQT